MAKLLDDTKRLMGALVHMKPKPHEDMKVGKSKRKKKKSPSKLKAKGPGPELPDDAAAMPQWGKLKKPRRSRSK